MSTIDSELKILYNKCSLFSSYSIESEHYIMAICPISTKEM